MEKLDEKKIRCFQIRTDFRGGEIKRMKDILEEFGLHVDIGKLECQSSRSNPTGEVIVSDKELTSEEIEELREFWPPCHDWSNPFEGPNEHNDVK